MLDFKGGTSGNSKSQTFQRDHQGNGNITPQKVGLWLPGVLSLEDVAARDDPLVKFQPITPK